MAALPPLPNISQRPLTVPLSPIITTNDKLGLLEGDILVWDPDNPTFALPSGVLDQTDAFKALAAAAPGNVLLPGVYLSYINDNFIGFSNQSWSKAVYTVSAPSEIQIVYSLWSSRTAQLGTSAKTFEAGDYLAPYMVQNQTSSQLFQKCQDPTNVNSPTNKFGVLYCTVGTGFDTDGNPVPVSIVTAATILPAQLRQYIQGTSSNLWYMAPAPSGSPNVGQVYGNDQNDGRTPWTPLATIVGLQNKGQVDGDFVSCWPGTYDHGTQQITFGTQGFANFFCTGGKAVFTTNVTTSAGFILNGGAKSYTVSGVTFQNTHGNSKGFEVGVNYSNTKQVLFTQSATLGSGSGVGFDFAASFPSANSYNFQFVDHSSNGCSFVDDLGAGAGVIVIFQQTGCNFGANDANGVPTTNSATLHTSATGEYSSVAFKGLYINLTLTAVGAGSVTVDVDGATVGGTFTDTANAASGVGSFIGGVLFIGGASISSDTTPGSLSKKVPVQVAGVSGFIYVYAS